MIFGEPKVDDFSSQAQINAAEQFRAQEAPAAAKEAVSAEAAPAAASSEASAATEAGIDQKDIDLVMNQASVSREKAIEAIKKNQGDIVNAIMELTGSN